MGVRGSMLAENKSGRSVYPNTDCELDTTGPGGMHFESDLLGKNDVSLN